MTPSPLPTLGIRLIAPLPCPADPLRTVGLTMRIVYRRFSPALSSPIGFSRFPLNSPPKQCTFPGVLFSQKMGTPERRYFIREGLDFSWVTANFTFGKGWFDSVPKTGASKGGKLFTRGYFIWGCYFIWEGGYFPCGSRRPGFHLLDFFVSLLSFVIFPIQEAHSPSHKPAKCQSCFFYDFL